MTGKLDKAEGYFHSLYQHNPNMTRKLDNKAEGHFHYLYQYNPNILTWQESWTTRRKDTFTPCTLNKPRVWTVMMSFIHQRSGLLFTNNNAHDSDQQSNMALISLVKTPV